MRGSVVGTTVRQASSGVLVGDADVLGVRLFEMSRVCSVCDYSKSSRCKVKSRALVKRRAPRSREDLESW